MNDQNRIEVGCFQESLYAVGQLILTSKQMNTDSYPNFQNTKLLEANCTMWN